MCDASSLDHPGAFQINTTRSEIVEQPDSCPKQDRHQIDMDFIQQSGLDALLGDSRAGYGDVLVPCGLLCLTNGAFNAIGDEGEGRSFLF